MSDTPISGGRRDRPRRPPFAEELPHAPLSVRDETDRAGRGAPSRAPASREVPIRRTRPRAEAAQAPAALAARDSVFSRIAPEISSPEPRVPAGARERPPTRGFAQPVMIDADTVNEPVVEAAARVPTLAAALPRYAAASAPRRLGAIWILVSLAAGLVLGGVIGAVAAMLILN